MVLYKNGIVSLYGSISPYCSECRQKLDWDEMTETKNEVKLEWTPAAQDKPTKKGEYLVYDKFVDSVYVYEYCPTCDKDVSYWRNYITHWMPCPKAPVAKKGE
jgi:endogenous inhibitor of DNA gyrase (YacG/DUF329 family)